MARRPSDRRIEDLDGEVLGLLDDVECAVRYRV